MADKTINQLIELTSPAVADLVPVWDTSTSITKSVSLTNLFAFITTEVGANYQLLAEKDVASGYCGLDAGVLVPTARMGSGTPSSTNFLRGDRIWSVIENLNTSVITEGVFAAARLGGGTPSGTTFLRGDMQWAVVSGTVATANSPLAGEFARFTDPTTIEGLTKAEAQAALDLEVGVDVQAYNAKLTTIAAMTPADNSFLVGNGTTWVNETYAEVRTSLGLGSMAIKDNGHGYFGAGWYFFDATEVNHIYVSGDNLYYTDGTDIWQLNLLTSAGYVDISGTPLSGQYARFVDGDTIQGRTTTQVRSDLELTIGVNIQEYSAALGTIASLTPTDGNIIVGNGVDWVAESGSTAQTSLGLGSVATRTVADTFADDETIPDGAAIKTYGDANWGTAVGYVDISGTPVANDIARFTDGDTIEGLSYAEFKDALDLEVGVDVQAYNTYLATIVGLSPADGNFIVGNGSTWVAESLATARGSLGLGSAALYTATETFANNSTLPSGSAIKTYGDANWGAVGYINTSGTPEALDIARFTDADTVEGLTYAELRSALGLDIGTTVQAYNIKLTQVAAVSVTDGTFIVGDGAGFVGESGETVRTSLGLGSAALRNVEDTLTNSENIADSAAIKAYGDANWGATAAHNLLSATHTDTAVGTAVAGDLILGTTGQWTKLARGTENQILASGATTVGWVTTINAAAVPSLDASKIGSGTIGTARLGTGTPSSSTYLRGDQTWATIVGASLWTDNTTYISPNSNTELKVYDGADTGHAAIDITKSVSYATDRSGSFRSTITRTGGLAGSAFFQEFRDTSLFTDGFDIAGTFMVVGDNMNGGVVGSLWLVAAGPASNTGSYAIMGMEVNTFERNADQGKMTARNQGKASVGIQAVPEVALWVTGSTGYQRGYNGTFGFAVAASGIHESYPAWGKSRWHTGFLVEADSIVPGGTGMIISGGTSAADDPNEAIYLNGHFGKGIDCSNATFNSDATALYLADLQKIRFSTASIFSSANVLSFYDGTTGLKTLAQLAVSGAGGSDTQIQFNSGGSLSGSSSLTWATGVLRTTNLNVSGTQTFTSGATLNGSNINAYFNNLTLSVLYLNSVNMINSNGTDIVVSNNASGWKFWNFQQNGNFRINNPTPPASSGASGTTGEISFDNTYLYVRTALGWRRATLNAF